jgi:hypothetical protein
MDKHFKKNLAELAWYMKGNGANIEPFPKVQLNNEPQAEPESIFQTTGYYNPHEKVIVLFTFGRHPKDVLRSFAHEMIHHDQNLSGEMTPEKIGEGNGPKYAQNNPHLRKLEEDAYLRGNMMFRDWTDNKKYK